MESSDGEDGGDEEPEAPTVSVVAGARRQSSAGSVTLPATTAGLDMLARQLSQTHSEPEGSTCEPLGKQHVERSVTWAEPRIKVIPPPASSARSMLMAMHTEYTRYNMTIVQKGD